MNKSLLALIVFSVSLLSMTGSVFAAGSVTLTPTSLNLSETQSTSVQVRLDTPIVGPGPGPAYFHLNLTASDPSRVSITPNPVDYSSADWFTIKSFTVTALDDGVHNASNNVTISFLVDSDSEYYDQYSGNFVLSFTDINPATSVQATVTQQVAAPVITLADTGQNTEIVQALSIFMFMTCGLVINRLRQYS